MANNYRKFLKLLESWPVDPSKTERATMFPNDFDFHSGSKKDTKRNGDFSIYVGNVRVGLLIVRVFKSLLALVVYAQSLQPAGVAERDVNRLTFGFWYFSAYGWCFFIDSRYIAAGNLHDIGFHLRERVKKAFTAGELFQGDEEKCAREHASLKRLADNVYGKLYKRTISSSATGLTAEQCNSVLSSEFLDLLQKENRSIFSRLFRGK
ncbi:uncharacterized protein LOC124796110 [Schistocerca piceifrons]|uniref:uncharacterized protein LOC124796110 n=1 Tax=Schistocerca piceifrons TaxID=274613 RepID=UPI001F5F533B|nr:uncharacterized protein LOC124796110 [Schistocerca piceifrons]